MNCRPLMIGTAALTLLACPALAGPCSQEIDRLQIAVDARIEAIAAAGPAGRESTAATLNHQPTPSSIAAAEEALGDGTQMVDAVAALKRAREADRAGDKTACEQALAEAGRAIAPSKDVAKE